MSSEPRGPISTQTAAEVAAELRCSTRHVRNKAREHGIGSNLGGKAGFRFTEDDVKALLEAMRPPKPVVVRRRRRAA